MITYQQKLPGLFLLLMFYTLSSLPMPSKNICTLGYFFLHVKFYINHYWIWSVSPLYTAPADLCCFAATVYIHQTAHHLVSSAKISMKHFWQFLACCYQSKQIMLDPGYSPGDGNRHCYIFQAFITNIDTLSPIGQQVLANSINTRYKLIDLELSKMHWRQNGQTVFCTKSGRVTHTTGLPQ